MKLPSQGQNLPVVLQVTTEPGTGRLPSTMSWRRQIGATVLDTRQFARAGRLVEETVAGAVEFTLQVDSSGGLHYTEVASRVLNLRLPRFPWTFGWTCVFNDIIWWTVFWSFALRYAMHPLKS
jgi:hypothetical protein